METVYTFYIHQNDDYTNVEPCNKSFCITDYLPIEDDFICEKEHLPIGPYSTDHYRSCHLTKLFFDDNNQKFYEILTSAINTKFKDSLIFELLPSNIIGLPAQIMLEFSQDFKNRYQNTKIDIMEQIKNTNNFEIYMYNMGLFKICRFNDTHNVYITDNMDGKPCNLFNYHLHCGILCLIIKF